MSATHLLKDHVAAGAARVIEACGSGPPHPQGPPRASDTPLDTFHKHSFFSCV